MLESLNQSDQWSLGIKGYSYNEKHEGCELDLKHAEDDFAFRFYSEKECDEF